MSQNDAPCLNCGDRLVTAEFNCHTSCKRYLKFLQDGKAEYAEKIKKGRIIKAYIRDGKTKYIKAKQQNKLKKR